MYLKDLTLVEPNLAHVALVDNAPMSFLLNPGTNAEKTTQTLTFYLDLYKEFGKNT